MNFRQPQRQQHMPIQSRRLNRNGSTRSTGSGSLHVVEGSDDGVRTVSRNGSAMDYQTSSPLPSHMNTNDSIAHTTSNINDDRHSHRHNVKASSF